MLNLCYPFLNYAYMRMIPPPIDPTDPPPSWGNDGSIGDIKYTGIVQVTYYVGDCTIIYFNPYTGLLRIRKAYNHGGEYKTSLIVKILNNFYSIDDFQGGWYHWSLNGPWQTYFKIDPSLTLPPDAWETNSSVMAADHSKDSTGLPYVWNIIKAPRHDFFQYARDVGIVQNGYLVLDGDTGTAPSTDWTWDDLIIHVRDSGKYQWNNPTIMLNKKYVDIIQLLYYIYITKNIKLTVRNVTFNPSNKEVKYA